MLKRCFDLIIASIGLLVLWPLFVLIAAWIKLDSPGPVLFRQVRVGRYGLLFKIHKFRTMHIYTETQQPLTVWDDCRITRAGRRLRKTKLDELPQLLDVLLGDMSLVGPRPEVPRYVAYYPEAMRKVVLSVRPGITDWASIQMIDENRLLAQSSNPEGVYIEQILPQKLAHYIRYVEQRNLREDIRIVMATLIKVITR